MANLLFPNERKSTVSKVLSNGVLRITAQNIAKGDEVWFEYITTTEDYKAAPTVDSALGNPLTGAWYDKTPRSRQWARCHCHTTGKDYVIKLTADNPEVVFTNYANSLLRLVYVEAYDYMSDQERIDVLNRRGFNYSAFELNERDYEELAPNGSKEACISYEVLSEPEAVKELYKYPNPPKYIDGCRPGILEKSVQELGFKPTLDLGGVAGYSLQDVEDGRADPRATEEIRDCNNEVIGFVYGIPVLGAGSVVKDSNGEVLGFAVE